jgi:hypothetical protein
VELLELDCVEELELDRASVLELEDCDCVEALEASVNELELELLALDTDELLLDDCELALLVELLLDDCELALLALLAELALERVLLLDDSPSELELLVRLAAVLLELLDE